MTHTERFVKENMMSGACGKKLCDGWEVITAKTFEEVESVRPIWEQMQNQQECPVINADMNRYLAMLKASSLQMQPCVMLLSFRGEPVTMVIARIEMHDLVCRIGYKIVAKPKVSCVTVVYGGLLGRTDREVCDIIINEFLVMLSQRQADMVFFNQLRIDSHIYHSTRTVPPVLCRDYFPMRELHWLTCLDDSHGRGSDWVSKKHRRDITRCKRNLEKNCSGVVRTACYRDKSEVDYMVEVISRISARTYKRGLGVGFVDDALHRAILHQGASDGWLRVYVLYAGDEPIAFEAGYVYGRVYFAEQAAFDPRWRSYSPGTILQLAIFDELKERDGIKIYDYWFGDAAYKQRFGSHSWCEAASYIFARRPYPILLNLFFSSVRGLSLLLAFLVNKFGFRARIKRYWRDILQKNTREHKSGQ